MTSAAETEVIDAGPGGNREFLGRNAVVTGAANGIGATVARELHRRGCNVLALDIAPEIIEPGADDRWVGRTCDVTVPDQVRTCLTEFARLKGPLDLLVSNAGVFTAGSTIDKLDLETWERGLRINLTSHFIVLQSFLAHAEHGTTSIYRGGGITQCRGSGPGCRGLLSAEGWLGATGTSRST